MPTLPAPIEPLAGTPVPRRALVVGAASVFTATWLLRWLTVGFTNDHFVHLARARQILAGEWPVRDFFDPGLLLHYLASAAALALTGHTLLGEALLTVSAVAFGTALTFYLAARLTGSMALAVLAAGVAAATYPRLYNYPKIVLYVLALLCAWRYIERATLGRRSMLIAVIVVAFLFRHDHGLYIGVAGATAIVLTHLPERKATLMALVQSGVLIAVMLLPFVLFLERAGGVVNYVRQLPSVQSIATPRLQHVPVAIDSRQPLLSIAPPSAGRVYVRWRTSIDDGQRKRLEDHYGLRDAVQQSGGFRYDVEDGRPAAVAALLRDPAVADTAGIDPASLAIAVHYRWLRAVRNAVPLFRLRVAPSLFSEDNVVAWLYYLFVLLPIVAGIATLVGWWRGSLSDAQTAALATLVIMALVMNQGLIRESPDSRLPDVAGPAAILGAALTTMALRGRMRAARMAVVAALWLITGWSAIVHGRALEQVAASRLLAGPRAAIAQWTSVEQTLRKRPIDAYAPAGAPGLAALTRYLFVCTAPADRVLVTWFAPEVPFYAERLFAGGQAFVDPGGWNSSVADQQLTISRLRAQRVPVVLIDARWEREVEARHAVLFRYLRDEYNETARASFGDDHAYVVLNAKAIRPRQTYAALGLPCYR